MIDSAGFADMRSYIKRRLSYARYRIGSTYYKAGSIKITDADDGTLRVQFSIAPTTVPATINRIELYNNADELWAHKAVSISIQQEGTSLLYWFDFRIIEEA